MDAIAEIKSRISIEELVAQYVPLKKMGRQFKALCPFHKEKTPSFYVSPERQIAYCFGCKKGGDHFKFIQEMEGLDFVGALKFLAEKAGVRLPKTTSQMAEKKTERDKLIEIQEEASQFFEKSLWETDDGRKVISYIKKRGLEEDTLKTYRLGFAPDDKKNALYTHLLEKNFTRADILAAGLAIARDTEQGECVDRFRMRLMFPIHNLAGDICAFGGRAIRDGDEPKYLNSPETPVFHKSSFLYGLAAGRADIRRKNNVVVVEGYMDALAAHQIGIKNAVACGGTSLTEEQLVILKRFAPEVVFSFDRDNAGKMATERAIEMALDKEFSIKVAVWDSDAKDPDECIRSRPQDFMTALENAKPASSYLVHHFAEAFGSTTADGKKKIIDSMLPFLAKIKSPVLLDGVLKELNSILEVSISSVYDELKRFQGKQKGVSFGQNSKKGGTSQMPVSTLNEFKREEYLIGLLLTYPEMYSVANLIVKPNDLEDIELQNIYRSLTTEYNQSLNDKERERANILAMLAETIHSDMTADAVEQEVRRTVHYIALTKLDREKRSIVGKLRTAQGDEKNALLETYQELLRTKDYGKET